MHVGFALEGTGRMIDRPLVVVFDVNETLSDLRPLVRRFADVGAPPHLLRVWFAGVLRDGFALTAAGAGERFAVLAADGLRSVLHGLPLDRDVDAAVEHVLAGFAALGVHPDVPDGVRALRAAGCRLVTLSNGSVDVAERLLVGAGCAPSSPGCCPWRMPACGSRPAGRTGTRRRCAVWTPRT